MTFIVEYLYMQIIFLLMNILVTTAELENHFSRRQTHFLKLELVMFPTEYIVIITIVTNGNLSDKYTFTLCDIQYSICH